MGSKEARHESIDFPGQSAVEVHRRVLAALADRGDLEVTSSDSGSISVARSYRPTWALVAGVAALPLCGIGVLLLLLVRRTDTCSVRVVDGARGSSASLAGTATATVAETVRHAMSLTTVAPSSAIKAAPSVDMPPPTQSAPPFGASSTASLPDLAEETRLRNTASAAIPLRLLFADGRTAAVDTEVLVGRSPSSAASGVHLVEVVDPERSVSKTHLAVRSRGGALWLEDLHSTNGTVIEHESGQSVIVRPGTPERLLAGSVVVFGGHRFEVVAAR